MRRPALTAVVPVVLLLAVAFAVRLSGHHTALLFPDGYQYLLMARGISEHLEPTTVLGPGGEVFAPNADAAAKPLFPVLVAAVHVLGVSWLEAARLVTALGGAVAVVALALLVSRLSGSHLAGVGAGLLLLASPAVAFWSGFSGPDALAQALVLLAALAFVHRRPTIGGVLAGLAIATRPEIALLALAAAIVAVRSRETRREVLSAAPAAVVTASVVFLLVRAPVALPDPELLRLAPLALAAVVLVALAPTVLVRYASLASLGVVAVLAATSAGPLELWQTDWPLLVLGATGAAVLVRNDERNGVAAIVLGGVLVLGAVYFVKNPTLGRYFSLLLPAAALLAGVAAASVRPRARPLAFAAIAVAVVAGVLHPVPGSRDYDMFPTVAVRIAPQLDSVPLVTAAPEAYGFWLPDRTVIAMERGKQGAILLDATQRLYEPRLTARGTVIARVEDEIAFAGPRGEIDADAAVLVSGRVVADEPRRTTASTR